MTHRERAEVFVKHYPNMFTEDIDFWVDAIVQLMDEHAEIILKDFYTGKEMDTAFKLGTERDSVGYTNLITAEKETRHKAD